MVYLVRCLLQTATIVLEYMAEMNSTLLSLQRYNQDLSRTICRHHKTDECDSETLCSSATQSEVKRFCTKSTMVERVRYAIHNVLRVYRRCCLHTNIPTVRSSAFRKTRKDIYVFNLEVTDSLQEKYTYIYMTLYMYVYV